QKPETWRSAEAFLASLSCGPQGLRRLVSQIRSSHPFAATTLRTSDLSGTLETLYFLVWWFRSSHDELAATVMRTSEPPHWGPRQNRENNPMQSRSDQHRAA